jgi:hypothetical protein
MPIKDLDELAYGTSEAEKISHLAVLILKHGQRLHILHDVCDICFDSLPPKFEKHVSEIAEGFDNLIEECDIMLKLTDKKQPFNLQTPVSGGRRKANRNWKKQLL